MTDIRFEKNGDALTVWLTGRVDSVNATEVGDRLDAIRAENGCEKLIIDLGDLNYISSAGLRILLRQKKAVPDTRVVNVSSDVYEILDVTGFTEMMNVIRAYRTVSVEGCEVIGRGANGEVYRIDPETIVKVYLNPDSIDDITRERELARTAFVLGIPTAISYDVVKIEGGGYGSVFELLNAKSCAKLIKTGEKTVDEVARISIDLLKTIHATEVKPDSMPSMKELSRVWIDCAKRALPADAFEKYAALMDALPDDLHMVHGDYHTNNIMIQNGETLLIDMDSLCHGDPVFEFAGIYNANVGFSELDHKNIEGFLGITFEQGAEFWRKSLEYYFDTNDDDVIRAEEDKARVMAYSRMIRRVITHGWENTESGAATLKNCVDHMIELLPRVDSLSMRK